MGQQFFLQLLLPFSFLPAIPGNNFFLFFGFCCPFLSCRPFRATISSFSSAFVALFFPASHLGQQFRLFLQLLLPFSPVSAIPGNNFFFFFSFCCPFLSCRPFGATISSFSSAFVALFFPAGHSGQQFLPFLRLLLPFSFLPAIWGNNFAFFCSFCCLFLSCRPFRATISSFSSAFVALFLRLGHLRQRFRLFLQLLLSFSSVSAIPDGDFFHFPGFLRFSERKFVFPTNNHIPRKHMLLRIHLLHEKCLSLKKRLLHGERTPEKHVLPGSIIFRFQPFYLNPSTAAFCAGMVFTYFSRKASNPATSSASGAIVVPVWPAKIFFSR